MFTFGFNSVAVSAVSRAVRFGMFTWVVVVAAGLAHAGKPHSLGAMSSGNGGGGNGGGSASRMQFNTKQFNNNFQISKPLTLSNQVRTMDFNNSGRSFTPKITTKVGGLSDVLNQSTNRGITIDRKVTGKLFDKPSLVNSAGGRSIADAINKDKSRIKTTIPGLADLIKNKDNGGGNHDGDHKDHGNGNGNGKHKDKCHNGGFNFCYKPCPWWYCWNYPTWCPLYRYRCGYWYDVPVVVIREGVDLQLLAVRSLDSGDVEQNLGPAFRVWIRNNSPVAIVRPFNVLLLAGPTATATPNMPQTGVRIDSILPGQILPIDIRLPVAANQPGLPLLHVVVDSHREIFEVHENNNGMVVSRSEVLPMETDAAGGTPTTLGAPMATVPVTGASVN